VGGWMGGWVVAPNKIDVCLLIFDFPTRPDCRGPLASVLCGQEVTERAKLFILLRQLALASDPAIRPH